MLGECDRADVDRQCLGFARRRLALDVTLSGGWASVCSDPGWWLSVAGGGFLHRSCPCEVAPPVHIGSQCPS